MLRTRIDRYVDPTSRPFRPVTARRRDATRRQVAIDAWTSFTSATFDLLIAAWEHGTSIELTGAEVVVVCSHGAPDVTVEVRGAYEPAHPMHVRSALILIDRLRPAIRREAPLSLWELDQITNTALERAATAYPVDAEHQAAPGTDAERVRQVVARRVAARAG